ncbi:helix-turn-helix transcriptional regulator [Planctobacterium marinum]|uniref:helix-turn-helix transcriptional regulator n=1 Tax=Planctobacterium marinum TaxID=1631968 RepID=UPI001E3E5A55|nr:AlpA family phage regulatory protein [Planctobacterium marinum]MCC2607340.1 AlpA family phage regulatory protein [Planctobacterium marinum]
MYQETPFFKVIRKNEVMAVLGISSTSLYRLINDSLIPPPFSLGCRAVGWYEHEINAVLKARAAGRNNDQIRELIGELLNARQKAA